MGQVAGSGSSTRFWDRDRFRRCASGPWFWGCARHEGAAPEVAAASPRARGDRLPLTLHLDLTYTWTWAQIWNQHTRSLNFEPSEPCH